MQGFLAYDPRLVQVDNSEVGFGPRLQRTGIKTKNTRWSGRQNLNQPQ